MILLPWAPILTFLVFASRDVNGIKPKCEADQIKPWSCSEKKGDRKNYCNQPVCNADQEEPWSYSGNNGPQFWKDLYDTCNGTRQSPINIVKENNVIVVNTQKPIKFNGYDEPMRSARMINNGHTVQISQTDDVTRSIEGGGLDGEYIFQQLHWHWGCNSCNGSEHLFDGRSYSLELHLVHTNSEGKIAVLGVLLKESQENNKAYDPIVRSLKDVLYKGSVTNLGSLTLANLLPKHRSSFYRYDGSLTTPECNEGVVWTVFPCVAEIGVKQLKEFRNLFSTPISEEERCPLVNNVRPVQPLNGRDVFLYQTSSKEYKRRI